MIERVDVQDRSEEDENKEKLAEASTFILASCYDGPQRNISVSQHSIDQLAKPACFGTHKHEGMKGGSVEHLTLDSWLRYLFTTDPSLNARETMRTETIGTSKLPI